MDPYQHMWTSGSITFYFSFSLFIFRDVRGTVYNQYSTKTSRSLTPEGPFHRGSPLSTLVVVGCDGVDHYLFSPSPLGPSRTHRMVYSLPDLPVSPSSSYPSLPLPSKRQSSPHTPKSHLLPTPSPISIWRPQVLSSSLKSHTVCVLGNETVQWYW